MKSWHLIICFILALNLKTLANSNYAVLLQESPAGAGDIKPGTGVHNFNVNETVTLITVANPGWKFVYWLGDVSDPTANRTMMSVDGPKIIIAVFQRDEYDMPADKSAPPIGVGPQTLTRRYDAIGGGSGGGGSGPPSGPHYYYPPTPPTPPDNPPPVPPEVPEPATMLLLSIGAGLLITNRKNNAKGLVIRKRGINERQMY